MKKWMRARTEKCVRPYQEMDGDGDRRTCGNTLGPICRIHMIIPGNENDPAS